MGMVEKSFKKELNLTTREDKGGCGTNGVGMGAFPDQPALVSRGEQNLSTTGLIPPKTLSFPFRATFKDLLLLLSLHSFPEHLPPSQRLPPF